MKPKVFEMWKLSEIIKALKEAVDRGDLGALANGVSALEEYLEESRASTLVILGDEQTPVQRFLALESPRFHDYAGLRVGGRDQYSRMTLEELREAVPAEVRQPASPDEATIYRWFLRGLPLGHAIRKVQVDRQVGKNARRAESEKDEEFDKEWYDDEFQH